MPAFDQCQEQVVRALQKDGWNLEQSPVKLSVESRLAYVDLLLSRGVNGTQEIVMMVEIKCFPEEDSTTRDLYTAIGQYLVYHAMIMELKLRFGLYLAIPSNIFDSIFDKSVMRVIDEGQIKVVVINLDIEEVVRWIR